MAGGGGLRVLCPVADVVSVATIGVPALVLPQPGTDNWSSLEALATLSLAGTGAAERSAW